MTEDFIIRMVDHVPMENLIDNLKKSILNYEMDRSEESKGIVLFTCSCLLKKEAIIQLGSADSLIQKTSDIIKLSNVILKPQN